MGVDACNPDRTCFLAIFFVMLSLDDDGRRGSKDWSIFALSLLPFLHDEAESHPR